MSITFNLLSINNNMSMNMLNHTKLNAINATETTTAPEPTTNIYWFFKNTATYMSFYFTPVVIIAGSIGNILSVMVFLRTKLKKLSSSYYLAFLAIFDTGFLWCNFIEWLNIMGIELHKLDSFCKLFSWLQYVCAGLSVWLVVAYTIERFVAVMYPLQRQSICTVRRARCIVCILMILSAISCVPLLIVSTTKVNAEHHTTLCTIDEDYNVSLIFLLS